MHTTTLMVKRHFCSSSVSVKTRSPKNPNLIISPIDVLHRYRVSLSFRSIWIWQLSRNFQLMTERIYAHQILLCFRPSITQRSHPNVPTRHSQRRVRLCRPHSSRHWQLQQLPYSTNSSPKWSCGNTKDYIVRGRRYLVSATFIDDSIDMMKRTLISYTTAYVAYVSV